MSTFNTRMTRGQTKQLTLTVRDSKGRLADLTNSKAYFSLRADIKIGPSVQLSSDDTLSSPWRLGILILDQTGELKGKFVVTIIPADTADLVALGDDDPWIWDAWIVDAELGTVPVIEQSNMGLYPEVTTLPA
jgi:alpha-mannosidase